MSRRVANPDDTHSQQTAQSYKRGMRAKRLSRRRAERRARRGSRPLSDLRLAILAVVAAVGFSVLFGVLDSERIHAAPNITSAAVAPTAVTANVPTAVTFTAVILDPSVISTTVNLLRYPAVGAPQIVGVLRDDGGGADLVAGDRTYTLGLILNESVQGPITFRVSAAFKGVLLRTTSSPLIVNVLAPRENKAPIANAGADQSLPGIGVTAHLNGSQSSDPDGDALTYQWTFVSRPANSVTTLTGPLTATPTFIPDKKGTYVLELTVRDATLASPADQVTVTVGNTAPTANAGTDFTRFVGQTAQLNGTASTDADADQLTYGWSFVSRPPGSSASLSDETAASPTFLVDRAGSYVLQLVVDDGTTSGGPDEVTVTTLNSPPTANAGADQTAAVFDAVTLDGTGSSDVDGDALTYRWSFQSRPQGSGAVLMNSTAVKPTFTIDVPGTYTVQLIVNDGTVDGAADTVVISTQNSAPVANAGVDQTAFVGQTVTLDGTGSTDVDGNALTYRWSFTSRPALSSSTLVNPTAVHPTFVPDKPGRYDVALIVNDGFVDSLADVVTITTQNSAPLAAAGADQTAMVGQTVTLDGSGSSDVDGNALTYSWSFTSVPNGSNATLNVPTAVMPTFVVDRPGTYIAQLIVNDGLVFSAPDTVVVTTINSPPIANAGPDQSVVAGQLVLLDGTASSDADGDPLTAVWSFTSRPPGSTATLANPTSFGPSFVADKQGTYVVQLIVRDATTDSAPDTVQITTTNSPPVANAGSDILNAPVGSLVTLDASLSSDADGHPLTYQWSLTSKPAGSAAILSNATSVNPTFTVDVAGLYVAQLIVDDGFVSSAPDTINVRTANRSPVANAGPDQSVPVGALVTLDSSASSDPDGDALTRRWELVSAPAGSPAVLSDITAIKPTFTADRPGAFIAQLTVNDGTVDSAADTITVTANQQNRPPVAVSDQFDVPQDGVLTIAAPGVLTNDSDPDGNSMTAVVATGVSHGQLTLNADGSFTYTPSAGFTGNDSFQYRASDGTDQSGIATVSITVVPKPAAPVVTAPIVDGATSVAGTGAQAGASVQIFVNGTARGAAAVAAANGSWQVNSLAPALATGNVVTARQTVNGIQSDLSAGVTVTGAGGSTAVIGATGGTIQLADGAKLEIPAGALGAPTQITVTPVPLPANAEAPPTGVVVGKLYSFEPHGLHFNQPVKMTFPYDPSLLPAGYQEGSVGVYRLSPVTNKLQMVGSNHGDPQPESAGQDIDPVANTVSVMNGSFSQYGTVAVNSAAAFVATTLTQGNASVTVLRPTAAGGLRTTKAKDKDDCDAGEENMTTRAAAGTTVDAIVLHSTNNGNSTNTFDGELGWATNDCTKFFAHYYLARDGRIFQVVDDNTVALHTAPNAALGISNDNAIGIEIFNNVGEPYDGRMIASLIRLLDYLTERYNLPRPQRNADGTINRNVSDITAGGDRIVTHYETDGTHKRDPIGTFQHSDIMVYLTGPNDAYPYHEANVTNGAAGLTLIKVIADAIFALGRTNRDTGVINTSGGDSLGQFNGGNAGTVTWREDAAQVDANAGAGAQTLRTENTPLLVPAGQTNNALANQVFTDAIILGTLDVTNAVNLRVTGTLFIGPSGRIIARNGNIGQTVQIFTRGLPLIQGLLETAAQDVLADSQGENGGNVEIYSSASGPFLLPTIVARGGDADVANAPNIGPPIGFGGTGGAVNVQVTANSHLFVGGGVGADARPAIRSTQVDPALFLIAPPEHVGDRLPPPPPFNLGSIGLARPAAGQRVPLKKAAFQIGFTRGILTSGGMGGTGTGGAGLQAGGPGGPGGAITLNAGATGVITFRDVDFTTGADVEMVVSDIFINDDGLSHQFFAAAGSLGGRGTITGGTSGGRGGPGGAAGAIAVTGTLNPTVNTVTSIGGLFDNGDVIGFNGQRPHADDDPLLDFVIGFTRQAASNAAGNLYRLRIDASSTALGGGGGIPSGHGTGSPGLGGIMGAGAPITGLVK